MSEDVGSNGGPPTPWRPDAVIVSVTRFCARTLWTLPMFSLYAHRSIAQLRTADGYIDGAVRQDAGLAFWTMTIWRDQQALLVYVTSGAHRKAMPRLHKWGAEAGVVRWTQDGAKLPDWATAERRLREGGHASTLRHPGPAHADLSFADLPTRYVGRL